MICKEQIACIALVVIVLAVLANRDDRTRENWFGSDAWNWTKKKASAVGNAIGNMAGATWDGLVYVTTKPAFSDVADYQKNMLDWVTDSGSPGASMGKLALGMAGEVGMMGLDTIYGTAQLPFKATRYAFDADYRDHVFDHGSSFSNWFDSDYDATLHPLPAGRGHLAEQKHKLPFLPIRW